MWEHGEGSTDPNTNLCLAAEEYQIFFVMEDLMVSKPREILTELK